MRRSILVLLVLILLFNSHLWARGKVIYALDLSDSYYAAIPHFDDEIPFRTSNATSLSLGLIGYEAGSLSVSLDFHTMVVTPSIPFGNYQGRGFSTLGLRVRASQKINRHVSFFSSISGEANYYKTIQEAFISYSVQLGAQFRILETALHAIDITIPLTIHLRKEITAPMLGVGLRYSLSPHNKQEMP